MFKLKDLNRYQKTYPLKRYVPVYNIDYYEQENQLLVPLDKVAGEVLNIFTDNHLDEVWIDDFIITNKKKLFIINTEPFDLNILNGDIIMGSNFNQDIINLNENNELIFNGWLNQGTSSVNENTKYFQLQYLSQENITEIIFKGIITE